MKCEIWGFHSGEDSNNTTWHHNPEDLEYDMIFSEFDSDVQSTGTEIYSSGCPCIKILHLYHPVPTAL